MAKKLTESDLFLSAADNNLENLKRIYDELTEDDKKRIIVANLDLGYDIDNIEEKMYFINHLPYEYKVQLIEMLQDQATVIEKVETEN